MGLQKSKCVFAGAIRSLVVTWLRRASSVHGKAPRSVLMKGCLIAGLRIIGGIVGLFWDSVLRAGCGGRHPARSERHGRVGWFMVFIPLGALLGGICGCIRDGAGFAKIRTAVGWFVGDGEKSLCFFALQRMT